MEAPFNEINKMMNNIKSGKVDEVFDYCASDIAIILNGNSISKTELIKKIPVQNIKGYTIECMNVVANDGSMLQTIHDTQFFLKEKNEFEGTYNIVTTWTLEDDEFEITSLIITKK